MAQATLRSVPRALRRLFALTPGERRFTARAILGAPVVELSLAVLGLKHTVSWIDALPRRPEASPLTVEAGVTAVARVYRHHVLPGRCLERALLQYALHRVEGSEVELEIGVRRVDGHVQAHAWVRGDDREPSYSALRRRGSAPLAGAEAASSSWVS